MLPAYPFFKMRKDLLYPIAITYPDWKNFCQLGIDYFGVSPLKGLDKSVLNTDNPSSYLRCIDYQNNPMVALENVDERMLHFHVTMGILTDKYLNFGLLNVLKNGEIHLISGTLFTWYHTIIMYSTYENDYLRFMNHAMIILEGAGFKDLFHRYKKRYIEEGQFILENK